MGEISDLKKKTFLIWKKFSIFQKRGAKKCSKNSFLINSSVSKVNMT